jgi:hypothetical protein
MHAIEDKCSERFSPTILKVRDCVFAIQAYVGVNMKSGLVELSS